MRDQANSKGRKENDAQPLGERSGLISNKKTEEIGRAERRSAGPDGPDATEVGNTFKGPSASPTKASDRR